MIRWTLAAGFLLLQPCWGVDARSGDPDLTWVGPVAVTSKSNVYGAATVPNARGSVDLAAAGYVEEEFFVSGHAASYDYDEALELRRIAERVPFTTRVLLRRPRAAERFSGTLHLEPAHPVLGGDSNWYATHPYVLRRGDAYVLVTAGADALTRGGPIDPQREALRNALSREQSIGVLDVMRWFDPERYARLRWPDDDGVRWDVLSQIAVALKRGERGPTKGLNVERVFASGWSFTGSLWRTYINEGFHDRARLADGSPAIDGYLIGISASAFVSGYVAINSTRPALPVGHPRRVTRSIDVPVIELMTENEAVTNTGPHAPENDSGAGRHRLYEVGGLSHGDGRNELGGTTVQHQLAQKGFKALRSRSACALEESDVPMSHLAMGALANLEAWVEKGVPPPRAERLKFDETGRAVRDAFGNILGGVRVAQLDLPLARYGEPGEGAPTECRAGNSPFLRIHRLPLPQHVSGSLYGDAAGYVAKFERIVGELVADRWIQPEEAARQVDASTRRAQEVFR